MIMLSFLETLLQDAAITRTSSRDEIANVNCFTTIRHALQSTIDLRQNNSTNRGHIVY